MEKDWRPPSRAPDVDVFFEVLFVTMADDVDHLLCLCLLYRKVAQMLCQQVLIKLNHADMPHLQGS